MADPKWDDTQPVEQQAPHWDDTQEINPSSISMLESLLRGTAEGITFNAAPAISATAQHPVEAFKKALNPLARLAGMPETSPEDTAGFDAARAQSLSEFKAAEEANPKTSMAGNVIGSVLPTLVAPEMGVAKLGAAMGALSGAGEALSEGQDVGDIGKAAAVQGTIGGVVGGVVGKIANRLAPAALKKSAAENAVEALHPPKAEVTKIRTGTGLDNDGMTWVGQNMLKPTQFLNGKSISRAMATPEETLANVNTVLAKSGKVIGDMANQADAEGMAVVTPRNVLDKIEELSKQYTLSQDAVSARGLNAAGLEGPYNTLNNLRNNILNEMGTNPDAPMTFARARNILKQIDAVGYNNVGAVANQDVNVVRGVLNGDIERDLEQVAKKSGNPALYADFMEAQDMYRTGKMISKSANNNVSKEITNADIGLLDYGAGAMGLHVWGGPGGVAAVAAKKFVSKNYNSVAAVGQDALANNMNKIATTIAEWTPDKIKLAATTLRNRPIQDPGAQKLANILDSMANKDSVGRNATMFTIMQVPLYRDTLRSLTAPSTP